MAFSKTLTKRTATVGRGSYSRKTLVPTVQDVQSLRSVQIVENSPGRFQTFPGFDTRFVLLRMSGKH
jgi:hypothetical protein